jgi:signal transduction histidine kinase/DNA-binding response OmpR family regulator
MYSLKVYLWFIVVLLGYSSLQAQQADSLRRVANQKEGIPKVYALFDLFRNVMNSDIEQARVILKETEKLSQELEFDKGKAIVMTMYCRIYQASSQFDSLYTKAVEGAEFSKSIDYDSTLARSHIYRGIYHEKTGTLDSAIYWYKQAERLDVLDPIFVNNNLGLAYLKLGQLESAAARLKSAIESAQKSGAVAVEAVISNNLGRIYSEIGDEQRAKRYYLRSIELKGQVGDERGKLFALANLTILETLPTEETARYTNQGYDMAVQLKDPYFITAFAPRKANLLSEKGRHDEALSLLMPVYENYAGSDTADEYQEVLSVLSNIYSRKGDYARAKSYTVERLKLMESNGQLEALQKARFELLEIYKQQKDYKAYFELAPAYFALTDSLNKAANIQQLAELDNQLKDVEQEKEIALLNTVLQQKETRRRWLMAIALFVGVILSMIIYFRSRQVKTQKLLIEQEQKNARELSAANDQLKSLDELKSRFFTNISHELRTPITLIAAPLANSLNQYKGKMEEGLEKSIQLAHKNANKLSGLVEELLELSRIEAGKTKLKKEPTPIYQYLNQLFIAFDSGAMVKNIKYHFDNHLTPGVHIQIDKKRFSKIINNLLSNALKYTAMGGSVTLTAAMTKEDQLIIRITDTGRGISAEDLPHVFDRYFQTKNNELATEGGTGIGLALAKELAEMMDGKLSVDSEWLKGSTFSFEMPVERVKVEAESTAVAEPAQQIDVPLTLLNTQKENSASPQKILIVEDNEDMQRLLGSLLAEKYDYVLANNGAEAWKWLQEEDARVRGLSLILSDVMMPEMDGYTLLSHIKQHDKWRQLPMVMLTARVAEEDKLKALRLGVDDYLAKPFSPEELFTRIENLISKYEERKTFNKLEVQLEFESTPSMDSLWLKELEEACMEAIDKKIDLTNSYLGDQLAISERHLLRRVKSLTGMSVKQYVQEVRLQKARHLLENRVYNTISEVAYESGFNTPKYFSRVYEKHFGKRPAAYFE